jgi:hypothetical protein
MYWTVPNRHLLARRIGCRVNDDEERPVSSRKPISAAEPARLGWIERNVRRYRVLLVVVVGVFTVLQGVAWAGLVPNLQPVHFGEVASDMVLAAGFGAPFLFHLRSLPRVREFRRGHGYSTRVGG